MRPDSLSTRSKHHRPLTSQYLNLTKNSSLAMAIGYPDLVSVFAGTTLNQTGQAIVLAIFPGKLGSRPELLGA